MTDDHPGPPPLPPPGGPVPILVAGREAFPARLREALASADHNLIISPERPAEEIERLFAQVEDVYADADGTLLPVGGDRLPPAHAEHILALHRLGVRTTMVTGKPYTEIERIVRALPPGFPLRIIFEKGAYCLRPDGSGVLRRDYLLSSEAVERRIGELRDRFALWQLEVEHSAGFKFAPAGHGTHQSVLSLDVLKPEATGEPNLALRGLEKVDDPILLKDVQEIVRGYLADHFPEAALIDLGNANWEITVGEIDKDRAIEALPDFAESRGVMVWGDSGNDLRMFQLRRLPRVSAGLVWHEKTPPDLLAEADFAAVGVMNVDPFFRKILEARRGLVRTGP
jgi:hydroxymethylpyrimidine pyrophosphatase-like HAD family hydrolase